MVRPKRGNPPASSKTSKIFFLDLPRNLLQKIDSFSPPWGPGPSSIRSFFFTRNASRLDEGVSVPDPSSFLVINQTLCRTDLLRIRGRNRFSNFREQNNHGGKLKWPIFLWEKCGPPLAANRPRHFPHFLCATSKYKWSRSSRFLKKT